MPPERCKGITMNSIEQQLNELIATLTPEQYRKVMTAVKTQSPTQVDMKYKLRRLRVTESYHSSAPKPPRMTEMKLRFMPLHMM